MNYFSKPTIYVSHSIRGPKGPNATEQDIRKNCKRASLTGEKLRRCFPDIDFYLPADGDLTLQILTASNRLNIDDVMFADLSILDSCSGYLWIFTGGSKGCKLEYLHAMAYKLCDNLNVVINDDVLKMSYSKLRKRIGPIVEAALNRWRKN